MTYFQSLPLNLATVVSEVSASVARARDAHPGLAAPSVLVEAVQWLHSAMLGTVATILAVTPIAFVGFGMLSGRIDVRRGFFAVLGCFVVFDTPSIAAGLL